jgi:hypothetical protein
VIAEILPRIAGEFSTRRLADSPKEKVYDVKKIFCLQEGYGAALPE